MDFIPEATGASKTLKVWGRDPCLEGHLVWDGSGGSCPSATDKGSVGPCGGRGAVPELLWSGRQSLAPRAWSSTWASGLRPLPTTAGTLSLGLMNTLTGHRAPGWPCVMVPFRANRRSSPKGT